jgi:hypothetical protein
MPWYNDFPGEGAASYLIDRFQRVLQLIWSHEFDKARQALNRWRDNLDLNGVPVDVLRMLEDAVTGASDALRQADDSLAQYHVRKALNEMGASPVSDGGT